MKKISFLLLGLCLTLSSYSTVNAATGYQVELGGGIAEPGKKLSVDATKLMTDVNYSIHCHLNATDATIMHFSIGGVFVFDEFPAMINSTSIGNISAVGQNGRLQLGANDFLMPTYRITAKKKDAILDFLNLDDTVVVTVSNCVATPV